MPRKAMARKITAEIWDDILVFYQANHKAPNLHALAVQHFNFSRKTLSTLYFMGSEPLGKPPIKSLMDTVEVKARAVKAAFKEQALREAGQEIQNAIAPPDMAKELSGKGPYVSPNAMLASTRKNTVVLQTIVGEMLVAVYQRLPELQSALATMPAHKLPDTITELRGHLTALANTAKVIQDLEKAIREEDEAGTIGKKSSIQSKEDATRVLEMTSRFVSRIAAAPLVVIPTDGETVSTRPDEPASSTEAVDEEDGEEEWDDDWTEDDTESDA